MAARTNVIGILLERIGISYPKPAIFSQLEVDDWPDGILAQLIKWRVLLSAPRADAITCPGCEWHCHAEVVVRVKGDERRAFITCDEEPALGRIPVSLSQLTQYQTSRQPFLYLSAVF